jgi:flagellar basal-body rod protein FlgB
MDPTRIGLFDLAEKRLAWTEQRQAVLARNIANASTPAFRAADLPSFGKTLSRVGGTEPVRTQPGHLSGTQGTLKSAPIVPKSRAPDGNTVALDEQLTKVADTQTTQTLVTMIYKKYVGMFSLALGRSQ